MFGIRYFYEMVQQSAVLQTNLYSDDIVPSLEFQPECIALGRPLPDGGGDEPLAFSAGKSLDAQR